MFSIATGGSQTSHLPQFSPQTCEEKLVLDSSLLFNPSALNDNAFRVQEDGSTVNRKVLKQ